MTLHPEVLWAQRSHSVDPDKVLNSLSLSQIGLVPDLWTGFAVDAVEHPVSDDQFARYHRVYVPLRLVTLKALVQGKGRKVRPRSPFG